MVIDGISVALCKTSRQVHHGGKLGHARAIGAGDEGMGLPVVSGGVSHHLPHVVNPGSPAIVSTECAEISHARAIRAGDKGMILPVVSPGCPYHLPGVVDPRSVAIVSTECAEISHAAAIGA